MKKLQVILIVGAAVTVTAAFVILKMQNNGFDTGSPVTADAATDGRIALVDNDLSTENLPDGWVHRTFWNVTPTEYTMTEIDGRRAFHCATDNSGSILARDVSLDLTQFPTLSWEWKIETPISSDIDEETRDGDDHPARFFVAFESDTGETSAAEIIWSNKRFAPGDYKIIGDFHHLVANGLDENIGVWHQQSVDLVELYNALPNQGENPKLTVLGFFCDSDNTGASSSAYFNNVQLTP